MRVFLSLDECADAAREAEHTRELFRERVRLGSKGVRLLGVGVSGIEPAGAGQAPLFPDASLEKVRRMARAWELKETAMAIFDLKAAWAARRNFATWTKRKQHVYRQSKNPVR